MLHASHNIGLGFRPDRCAVRLLTIFADASYHEGAGGLAWWARGDGAERVRGAMPWCCDNNHEPETIALAMGFFAAIDNLPTLMRGGSVILQSDSTSALGAYYALECGLPVRRTDSPIAKRAQISEVERRFVLRVKEDIEALGLKVWLKHIKGHTQREDPRYGVNKWCDQQSRLARQLCAAKQRAKVPIDLEAALKDAEFRAGLQSKKHDIQEPSVKLL
jgi:hypothetical protein